MATTEEDLTAAPTETRPAAETPATTNAPAPHPDAAVGEETKKVEPPPSPRIAVAVAFPTIAAGILVGGIFLGFGARLIGPIAGLLGIGLAYFAARLRGRPILTNVVIIVGLFAIGLLLIGPGNILDAQRLASGAAKENSLLRPPVPFSAGWRVITAWLMGTVGFSAGWVAMALRKPAAGLLLPLPVAAFACISIPDSQQVASGIALLVLFGIALGILSSEQSVGEDGEAPSVAYELRKAAKSVPLLAVAVAVLYGMAQAGFLFPDQLIDPAQEPQKPKTQPLSEVEDRVLFEVESELSGPWRIGSLDVYDGKDWRLPPFAASQFDPVPKSGVVDPDIAAGVKATFIVRGLGGAVLPTLPNTVGIIAEGPQLSYDTRNANIRLVNGVVQVGQRYTVAAAGLPSVDDLNAIASFDADLPDEVQEFTLIADDPGSTADRPPAVADLLERAAQAAPSKWGQFDFARTFVLENVVASGTGSPVSITPERVQDILAGTQNASPFEIVATQALLARWMGVPSRIGYGFDGGDEVNNRLEVRPKHGAAFVEVYFPGFKWLPVIGTPRQAEPTVGSDPSEQRTDPNILPSDAVAVQIFLPTVVPPDSVAAKQIAVIVLVTVIVLLILLLLYILYPAVVKIRRRSHARAAALENGTVRGRVALAYTDWRDYATDFGFLYTTDTPLMFLDRFQEDEEHTELAWLTTRVLWGDLQGAEDPMLASVAEELSRSLRRRLASAQPATGRVVAIVSRLSLRHQYAPETDLSARGVARQTRKESADASINA
ncbi:MAG: transglutaminase domain-containing protein [Acidimicrobiales bacterium]